MRCWNSRGEKQVTEISGQWLVQTLECLNKGLKEDRGLRLWKIDCMLEN